MKKKKIYASVIVLSFLMLSLAIYPSHAQSYWSKSRPSSDIIYDDTIQSESNNAYSYMALGVQIWDYDEESPEAGQDEISMRVVVGAHTRYGISYATEEGSSVGPYLWGDPTGITGDNTGAWIDFDGWHFTYYGARYDKVWVCSNGFISFNSTAVDFEPDSIPDPQEPNYIIAPFWRDLDPSKGGIIREGWGPGDQFIISWDHVPNHANENEQTFEVALLFNTDPNQNSIIFRYGDITNDVPTSIGVEDQAGDRGTSYDVAGLPSWHYIWFTPQNMDTYLRSGWDHIRIRASKPAGGDNKAKMQIAGAGDAGYPGGTNVQLKQPPVDGEFYDTMLTSAGIVITLASLKFKCLTPIGWAIMGIEGAAILAGILSEAPSQASDVYFAGINDPEVFATGYAYDEKFEEDFVWDVSFAAQVRWIFTDANNVGHDLKITAELKTNRPEADLSTSVNLNMFIYTPPDCCVAEGTLITMADGATKPIEDIKKGDQVLGFWPTNSSYMTENVLDIAKGKFEVMVNINNGMLKITPLDHPIFIRNSTYEGWVKDPADIQVGWEIYNATSHGWVPVSSVTFEEGKTRGYDLVLDGYETYIANGILVMDKNGGGC